MMSMPVLVLLFLTFLHVYTIHRHAKISIYCRQNFVNIGSGARSRIQCASNCLSCFTPYCKAFIWNKIDKTCSHIDEIVKVEVADRVDVPMQSELDIYSAYKDGCTNRGYYYDFHSNTCLKIFVDNDGKTWKNASNHCQKNGGDLISLTTPAKWDFVTNFTSCVSNVWIGLKDKRWVSNDRFQNVLNVKVQFNNFDSGFFYDHESVCVSFKYANQIAVLQDESCNIRLKQTYVCEILV
ncbi:MRC [Mytilus coruscus]|uniref:MRC n=1 Tax=Mytilus coruscus TaxID=42192 RepID=A0A6J8C1M4_MYTCO|nr:MRC [Mytilus coruscus]